MRSGSSAARSTPASTVSIAICAAARRNKAAIIWEGEPGDRRTLTYFDLHREVCQFANVLKSLGIETRRSRRDLPAADSRARHRDAGVRPHRRRALRGLRRLFSAESLRDRINDAQARLLDHRRRRLPPRQRRAAQDRWPTRRSPTRRRSSTRSSCAAVSADIPMHHAVEGRDHWYHELMAQCAARLRAGSDGCRGHALHPLHLGHDRQAKGIVHTTGGYLVGTYATTKWVFDLKEDDVYWCTADIGWVTGHSYVVYGPLANGATVVMYEGAPDWPQKDRFWAIDRALRRDDLLHRADGHPRVHAMGHRLAGEARSVVAAAARIGRRADQPRSVDLVSPAHRRRALPDRRYLVADRNRRHHDHAAAGHHLDQARLGDAAVSWHQRRDPHRQRRSASRSAAACSR